MTTAASFAPVATACDSPSFSSPSSFPAPPSHREPENPAKPGRPALLTSETLACLTSVIADTGCSDTAAAELLHISSSTISRWKKNSSEFSLHLLRARQLFRQRQLELINRASTQRGGWRAAAWLLERIFPEDYAPRAADREKFARLAEERRAREKAALAERDENSLDEMAISPAPAATVSDSQNSQNPSLPPPDDCPNNFVIRHSSFVVPSAPSASSPLPITGFRRDSRYSRNPPSAPPSTVVSDLIAETSAPNLASTASFDGPPHHSQNSFAALAFTMATENGLVALNATAASDEHSQNSQNPGFAPFTSFGTPLTATTPAVNLCQMAETLADAHPLAA